MIHLFIGYESKHTSPAASPRLHSKVPGSPTIARGHKPLVPLLPPNYKQKQHTDQHKATIPWPGHATSSSPLLQRAHVPKPNHTLGSHAHMEKDDECFYQNVNHSYAVQEANPHNDETVLYVNVPHGRVVLGMQELKSQILVRSDSYRQSPQSQFAFKSPRVATRPSCKINSIIALLT